MKNIALIILTLVFAVELTAQTPEVNSNIDTLAKDSLHYFLPPNYLAKPLNLVFYHTGGEKSFAQIPDGLLEPPLYDYRSMVPVFLPFDKTPSGKYHNEVTSQDSTADGGYIFEQLEYDEDRLVNYMLGTFIKGNGPENIIFPLNGVASEILRESFVIRNALDSFSSWSRRNNDSMAMGELYHMKTNFRVFGMVSCWDNITGLQHFVGSADIIITPIDATNYYMAIYNVSSITSIDLFRAFKKSWFPSGERNAGVQPYSNTSQVYQLSFTLKEIR